MNLNRAVLAVAVTILAPALCAERICVDEPRQLFRGADLVAEVEIIDVARTTSVTSFSARPTRTFRRTFVRGRDATSFTVAAIGRSTACCHVNVSRGDRVMLYAHLDAETGRLETDQCRVLTGAAAERHIATVSRWRWLWRLLPG